MRGASSQRVAAVSDCSGITLIEVLLAIVILGGSMAALLTAVAQCMQVYTLAAELQQVQWVIGKGEMEHPLIVLTDPEDDLPVSGDADLVDGFVFSREVEEEGEEEDGLFIVRTKVTWGRGGPEQTEEIVRYIYHEK